VHNVYPHLNCIDELKQISDLTDPTKWYPNTRALKRKIIYHSGPTNSGKTYSALKAFESSESGIYCGPLKLLANEVFTKMNNNTQTKCDLLTGEERKFGNPDGSPAQHLACTVEMANLERNYDVAVIDEIQMIKDGQRGWAWTRALLGLKAKEIHLCGDSTVVDLISDLSFITGDDFSVNTYERLTPLTIMDTALKSFDFVEPGDCFVCFNKTDIFKIAQAIESRGHEVAVIYGSMPPGVKLAQANRFNNPDDKCKILVSTDAIGMGLNLNIRRIIFYSIKKPQIKEVDLSDKDSNTPSTTELEFITSSQALQIAGRAGRFNTAFSKGFVTTFYELDLKILKDILKQPLEKTTKAGLNPTADQIELFSYYLPNQSLSSLISIFRALCKIDSVQYFLCNINETIYLADLIDHIPLKLRSKYIFATSPINRKQTFVCSCFVRFVRLYSNNEPVTIEKLKTIIGWPLMLPKNVTEVSHLESVYDVFDLYLWLSYRFPDIFSYYEEVIQMRYDLEKLIYEGVKLLFDEKRSQLNIHRHKITQSIQKMNSQFNLDKNPSTKYKENKRERSKSVNSSQFNQVKLGRSDSKSIKPTTLNTTSVPNTFKKYLPSDEKPNEIKHEPNVGKDKKEKHVVSIKSNYERLVGYLKMKIKSNEEKPDQQDQESLQQREASKNDKQTEQSEESKIETKTRDQANSNNSNNNSSKIANNKTT
jgi:ATP-dependent RNA helicase SUPV3L1/SUV3